MLRRLMLLVVIAFALSPLVLRAQEGLRPITLFLTFVPNIQFSPVYVGIERGYFADAGLEVTIIHGDEPDGVNLVAAGEMEFAMISGEQVIVARANGRPVVSVYEWFQKYPVGVVVPNDGTIAAPADLRGRKVGIPGLFGASYTGLIALLNANGLTEGDIELEPIGFNAPQVFCAGAVEGAIVYINNEPTQIDRLAAKGECGAVAGTTVFGVSDYVDMVSNGLITSEALIEQDPVLVQDFLLAFHKGLVDTMNQPAEAYAASASYVESLPLTDAMALALAAEAQAELADPVGTVADEATAARRAAVVERLRTAVPDADWVQMEVLLNTAKLWAAPTVGMADAESWQNTADVLTYMGLITEPIDVEEAFTNELQAVG